MDVDKTKYIVINESVIGSIIKDIVTFSMFAGLLLFNHWFLGGSTVVDVMFIILTLGFLAGKHSKTRFEDFIVNQFTGRTDKEGKEIYEDDILLIIGQGYFRVTWDRDNCKFYLLPLEDYLDKMPLDRSWEIDYEVEGNIHENKDLLEYIEKDQKTK